MSTLRNVVLVHGGFVDGSGWQGVYESLRGSSPADLATASAWRQRSPSQHRPCTRLSVA
jgi:hypothetical protein